MSSSCSLFSTPNYFIPTLSPKDPYDAADFGYDFTPFITLPGDYIASVSGVFISPATTPALICTQNGVVSGIANTLTAVGMTLASGSAGTTYTVTTQIVTEQGEYFSRSFYLPVSSR